MWKCPSCENEIETLDYEVPAREWGSAYLSEPDNENSEAEMNNHETSNSEWTDDVNYFCPECNEEVDLSDLILVKTEQEKEKPKKEELEEEKFNIIKPEIEIQVQRRSTDQTDSTMICKHCYYVFVYFTEKYGKAEEFTDCPNCGKQNNRKEYKQMIKDRFFEQIKIKKLKKKHGKKIKGRRLKLVGRTGQPIRSAV